MNCIRASLRLVIAAMLAATFSVPANELVFLHGNHGGNHPFKLQGGSYSLYVYARFPNFVSRNSCIFIGNLQRVSPNPEAAQLGGPVPVTAIAPFKLGPMPVKLPAGQYSLYLASQTDCIWQFALEAAAPPAAAPSGSGGPSPLGSRRARIARRAWRRATQGAGEPMARPSR